MTKTVHFRYRSPENFVRLLCDIVYEKKHSPMEITVYHERFADETDDFFANMLLELFPNGATIGEKEIDRCVEWIDLFLSKDGQAKDIRVKYDMECYSSYVYFDIDKIIYPCDYCSHQQTVEKICVDYFRGFDSSDLTVEKIAKFIREHFVVKSSFSSAESIARDARYILFSILSNN